MNSVHVFWQTLYTIQHTPGQFEAWTVVPRLTKVGHVVYAGSAIQSFLCALYSHGTVLWGQLGGLRAGG
jgi:hypothetical protein